MTLMGGFPGSSAPPPEVLPDAGGGGGWHETINAARHSSVTARIDWSMDVSASGVGRRGGARGALAYARLRSSLSEVNRQKVPAEGRVQRSASVTSTRCWPRAVTADDVRTQGADDLRRHRLAADPRVLALLR